MLRNGTPDISSSPRHLKSAYDMIVSQKVRVSHLLEISPHPYYSFSIVRSVLCDVSRILESLYEVSGIQSFLLAVDPNNPSDDGFLGGTVVGREFWRGLRGGGEAGAKAFRSHCLRELESNPPPAFPNTEGPSSRSSSASVKQAPAKSLKNDLYEHVRTALRLMVL
jgi:hypothetical protein